MNKPLFRKILFFLSVPKCVCCGERLDIDDYALCKKCYEQYLNNKNRNCSRCNKVLSECFCSNFFLERHSVKNISKVYRYTPGKADTPESSLIYSLKQSYRWDVFEFLSNELIASLRNNIDVSKTDDCVITNVPRRRKAIIRHGYDHSAILAKRISKKLNIPYRNLLVHRAKKAQKELKGRERLLNAKIDYRQQIKDSLGGKTVILVDDIVTSGASLGTSGILLRGLKAKKVIGACVGIAYKDSYIPIEKSK